MSGTLILLAKAGCEIHYMNIVNGSCGTAEHDTETIVAIRLEEAKNAGGAQKPERVARSQSGL